MTAKTNLLFSAVLVFISSITIYAYWIYQTPRFLNFSDAAKFADIARNIVKGKGYYLSFSYPEQSGKLPPLTNGLFKAPWVPPLFPYSISAAFLLAGISDNSVIFTSSLFFISAVVMVFLLGKQTYGRIPGMLAAIALVFHAPFLGYATQGASETLLIFEIILALFLLGKSSHLANLGGFFLLGAMYFTRPQGFIYILGLVFFYVLLQAWSPRKIVSSLVAIFILGVAVEGFLISSTGQNHLYSITLRGLTTLPLFSSLTPNNQELRGVASVVDLSTNIKPIFSKGFYNLYNFFKLTPQILSPFLIPFFALAYVKKPHDRRLFSLNLSILIMGISTAFVTAISIPFIRYLHPMVPLIYLVAAGTFYEIVKKIYSRRALIISLTMLIVLVVTPTIGNILLDSRFMYQNQYNYGKPPVYAILGFTLKDLTAPDDIVLTNLDTWGSWYGQRRTVWYPLHPSMVNSGGFEPDAIYLTTYKSDDPNYLMGPTWRELFSDQPHPSDATSFILDNYKMTKKIELSADQNYERETVIAVLYQKNGN